MTTIFNDELVTGLDSFFLERNGWEDFTPTVDQNGAVAATVTFARYIVLAQTVIVQARLAITGAGNAGNAVSVGGFPTAILPVNTKSRLHVCGTIVIYDSPALFYQGAFVYKATNDFGGIAHNVASEIGITPNFALANGDTIGFQGTWER